MTETKRKDKKLKKIDDETRVPLYEKFLEMMAQKNALHATDATLQKLQAEMQLYQQQKQTVERELARMDADLQQKFNDLKIALNLPPTADFNLKTGDILYPLPVVQK